MQAAVVQGQVQAVGKIAQLQEQEQTGVPAAQVQAGVQAEGQSAQA